ncbi:unnamed protein product [Pylaiella littoralis]
MVGKAEEQHPLATCGRSFAATVTPAAAASAYGALSLVAAAPAAAAAAAELGASTCSGRLNDVLGEDVELEAGQRRLLVEGNGTSASAGTCAANNGAATANNEGIRGVCLGADEMLMAENPEEYMRQGLTRASSSGELSSGFATTFRGRSPKFIRFGVLLLITLLPFGAHFVKSCFSSLETYFLEDPKLHFNETKYGSLVSAISMPNLFMPFFGGLFLDSKGHKKGIILFLTLELLGHVLFTLAMEWDHFWLAITGEVLHGFGSGSVVVAMRTVVSQFFLQNELTFAHGVTIAGACVSKTLAKASVAPIAETKWGYMGALWYAGLWQLMSLVAGLIYVRLSSSARRRVGMGCGVGHKDRRVKSLLVALRRSTLSFWLVAVLHTLLIMAYHLFANYSGHFLVENYHVSPVLAGYISALMPLVVAINAPIAGLVLDRWGRQLYVLVVANIVTIVAYVMLLQNWAGGVVCILMLALCESFVPTILLSALPLTVHPSVYGAAFGMAEVLSAVATIVANVWFGYSRDQTASYEQDLSSLVVLCFVCLALTLFLLFWDAWEGQSLLNRSRRVMPADVKALG